MFLYAAYVGKVISEAYELEYGTDCLEMHVGAVQPGERALVIDDLVATGGTLSAAIRLLGEWFSASFNISVYCSTDSLARPKLIYVMHSFPPERVGAEVVECACVIGLPEVKVMLKPL